MRKLILLLVFSFSSVVFLNALNIKAGTYYFDNSKTRYGNIQFLYGTDTPAFHTLINLSLKEGDVWELIIPNDVNNVYRYSFCATNLNTGTFTNMGFSDMKEYVSKTLIVNRTATTDAMMIVGGTFTPSSGDNWTQGNWQLASSMYSGTLPVFWLNTENNAVINTKEYYINASFYIDADNIPGYVSVGSKETPVTTEVRGRGNYTWREFDKKPYRIKMAKKASLLDMTTDKSYALLAHADDNTFLRNEVGFKLSRLLGMAYTPLQEPIELMLNGEYRGLYFLTDQIKVSSERVNVVKQKEGETNPELVTGGWLIEIDNYEDPRKVSTRRVPRFTVKSPDNISSVQEAYIRDFLQQTEDAIYLKDKNNNRWEDFIDLNTLVDFYIIQEITGNTESFNGSCFFSKDRGSDTKIFFGPVWDFGNAFRHGHKFIYQDIQFSSHWLPEIVKYPHFQNVVKERWSRLQDANLMNDLYDYIDSFTAGINQAVVYDYNRWKQYGSKNYSNSIRSVKNYLEDRVAWLNQQWYTPANVSENEIQKLNVYPNPSPGTIFIESPSAIREIRLYNFIGTQIHTYSNVGNSIHLDVDNGTYILQIVTENEVLSKVIMKQLSN